MSRSSNRLQHFYRQRHPSNQISGAEREEIKEIKMAGREKRGRPEKAAAAAGTEPAGRL